MRVLHTSDWHLGKTLEGRSRGEEQERFVDELVRIVHQNGVQLVVVAGDLFDAANPPAAAEELYYDALARLAEGGRRAVVVIAGNHDNPERLAAAGPLAHRHGITLLGRPGDTVEPLATDPGRVRRLATGQGWVELAIPDCDHTAVVAALPYPSEARLNESLAPGLDPAAARPAYDERVRAALAERASHFRADAIRIATSHLYIAGGEESESERPIQVGGVYAVRAASLPPAAQYVALGHFHRPQPVPGAPTAARYSGSPLAYSFSEAGQAKSVVLVDLTPGIPRAAVETLPLSAGRPLARWTARGGLEEVLRWCSEGRDPTAFVDLAIHLTVPLTAKEIHDIRAAHPGVVHIRPVLPGHDPGQPPDEPVARSAEEQFVAFYRKQNATAAAPDPELVTLFLELLGDSERVSTPPEESA